MNLLNAMNMDRRHFVKHMAAASMTLPMINWLNAAQAAKAKAKGKTHSMILLWMSGGPSTIDIWDLKPGSKNGGEFKPIATTGAGQICEHLPKLAQQMKHLNIVRSFNSRDGAHERGTYILHTAFPPLPTVVHPAIGAVTASRIGSDDMEIPGHISLNGPGVSPGFLGMNFAPFRVDASSQEPIPNLNSPLGEARFEKRRQLLSTVETGFTKQKRGGLPSDHQTIYDKTFKLMHSSVLDAFKIEKEDPQTLAKYGESPFAKNCLMARRLVEIGVPFIEVGFGGWDNHQGIWNILGGSGGARGGMMGGQPMLPQLDQGFAALVEDLVARGLWENTTVCWMGDFGRTPKINQDGGRDHWPACWSVVLGGGAMKGGEVVGKLDDDGMSITDRPVEVSNLFATLYKSIGIDPNTELRSPNGRPLKLTGILGDGKEIQELF